MENGETKTASVSIKGRKFSNADAKRLALLEKVFITPNMELFKGIKVHLEMRKRQWAKPYKVIMVYEPEQPFGTISEEVLTILMIADYEVEVGRFKDCSF